MGRPASLALLLPGALLLGLGLVACGSAKVDLKAGGGEVGPPPPPPMPPAPAPLVVASSSAAPPPPPAQQVAGDAVLEGDRIRIAKAIFYDVDKDEIRPESFPVLNAVAQILRSHPEIVGLVVEGHTDSQGTYEHNLKLSERRSQAVVRYLAGQGIGIPMQAPGYGATSPQCHDASEACLQRNRRVEFKVKKR